jgi:hypothetical protein
LFPILRTKLRCRTTSGHSLLKHIFSMLALGRFCLLIIIIKGYLCAIWFKYWVGVWSERVSRVLLLLDNCEVVPAPRSQFKLFAWWIWIRLSLFTFIFNMWRGFNLEILPTSRTLSAFFWAFGLISCTNSLVTNCYLRLINTCWTNLGESTSKWYWHLHTPINTFWPCLLPNYLNSFRNDIHPWSPLINLLMRGIIRLRTRGLCADHNYIIFNWFMRFYILMRYFKLEMSERHLSLTSLECIVYDLILNQYLLIH